MPGCPLRASMIMMAPNWRWSPYSHLMHLTVLVNMQWLLSRHAAKGSTGRRSLSSWSPMKPYWTPQGASRQGPILGISNDPWVQPIWKQTVVGSWSDIPGLVESLVRLYVETVNTPPILFHSVYAHQKAVGATFDDVSDISNTIRDETKRQKYTKRTRRDLDEAPRDNWNASTQRIWKHVPKKQAQKPPMQNNQTTASRDNDDMYLGKPRHKQIHIWTIIGGDGRVAWNVECTDTI